VPRQARLSLPLIRVVVGLLEDTQGNVLLGQRRKGTHMEGRWEFPGGKRRAGESAIAALRRELREELSIDVLDARRLLVLDHDYDDRRVQLDTWRVSRYSGRLQNAEGQALCWVAPDRLETVDLLEADAPIVEALLAQPRSASRIVSSL
jgi:8-oxo-dGTP diphosphatase